MIRLKTDDDIKVMIEAGRRLARVFVNLASFLRVGLTTLEIDSFIDCELKEMSLISGSKGYHGYRHVSCISINDEVVHGVPCADKRIFESDLVKIDISASYKGLFADMARSFVVGKMNSDVKNLIVSAQRALDAGIDNVILGKRLSNVSAAIQSEVEASGFGVVRDFAGHGIGHAMHEEPEILNYGKPGRGPRIEVGMAFAIEPMITMGRYDVYVANDGWTAKTSDGSLAAHVEDTVVVTDQGPVITTRL